MQRIQQALEFSGVVPIDLIYLWRSGKQLLFAQHVVYRSKVGAILYYENSPAHQINFAALVAYQRALERIQTERQVRFLIFISPNAKVHAGGDLKETAAHLRDIDAQLKNGHTAPQDAQLYAWADARLQKAFELYSTVRELSFKVPIVAVCGSGVRYGGSAEIPLWTDYIVGDALSSMCFSETTIGLIPGWGGVGRLIAKAGYENAYFMACTARQITAHDLLRINIYNALVDTASLLPRAENFNSSQDYSAALEKYQDENLCQLLKRALEIAVLGSFVGSHHNEVRLASMEDTQKEVTHRANPLNFTSILGKPLKDVQDAIALTGKPLAPQSIAALDKLFERFRQTATYWDEGRFVEYEMQLDAELYRDMRLREGITAALEARVADFRDPAQEEARNKAQ